MAVVKRHFWKTLALLSGFLSSLLAGCFNFDFDPIVAEYGMPTTTFKASGTVKNSENEPLQNISVMFFEDSDGNGIIDYYEKYSEQDYNTNQNGNFSLVHDVGLYNSNSIQILFKDVDGEDNGGLYDSVSVKVEFNKTDDGSGWDEGTYEKHDIDVLLQKHDSETAPQVNNGEIQAVYTVRGSVLNISNDPLSEIIVELLEKENHEVPLSTTYTGSDGSFCFDLLSFTLDSTLFIKCYHESNVYESETIEYTLDNSSDGITVVLEKSDDSSEL